MKKWNLLWMLMILTPSVIAQGFGHGDFGNYPFGHSPIIIEEKKTPPNIGGGPVTTDTTKIGTGLLYDVFVSVLTFLDTQGATINVTITIHNKQGIPTKDAILTYYLLSPNNEIFNEVQEVFLPENKIKHTFIRELNLPNEMETGQWKVVVIFDPVEEDPIEAFASFEVIAKKKLFQGDPSLLIILILISIIVYGERIGRKGEYP